MRYTATIRDNHLHEVGDRIAGGAEPVRVFEMVLERIGDSTWPEQGAIATALDRPAAVIVRSALDQTLRLYVTTQEAVTAEKARC